MTVNFVVTSKPGDGLLFYSYEYCSHLNSEGIPASLCIIPHRHFAPGDYIRVLQDKYVHCDNLQFDDIEPKEDDISIIMGRSQLTLAHMTWNDFNSTQRLSLKRLFENKLISVYSENHVNAYPVAIDFFRPKLVWNLCDKEVYPDGVGTHFEKTIHFDIYKDIKEENEYEHLFLGTNDIYYDAVNKVIDHYPDHGILVYKKQKLIDSPWSNNNHIFAPIHNLLGKFNTYVYTKPNFDPAPRLFQEFRWLGKKVIYERNKELKDGGPIYWERGVQKQDITEIVNAVERLSKY